MIKKIILTVALLISISMCLMSCGKNKLEKYFNIQLTSDMTETYLMYALTGDDNISIYGILITPKEGLDLKVNGKVVFKKIKFSYYDKHKTQRFISNESEFEIELNEIGTNRNDNSRNVDNLSKIKNKSGEQAFPKLDDFYEGDGQKIVEYDAYFVGTIEKR